MVPQEVKQCCAFTHHGAYMIVIETVIEQVRAPLLLQRWNMCHNVIMISERILWHSGKESACQCQRHKWCSFNLWVGKMPWRKEWQPTPVFLLGKSHGQRSLAGYSPWGHKELVMTDPLRAHTHSLNSKTRFHSQIQQKEGRMVGKRNCLILQVGNQSHFFG